MSYHISKETRLLVMETLTKNFCRKINEKLSNFAKHEIWIQFLTKIIVENKINESTIIMENLLKPE